MEFRELSGPEFVRLMEEHGIRPSDLGIKPNYKYMLKKGERKPSRDLVLKLYKLVVNSVFSGVRGPVAQPGRALGWHPRGPGFKSRPVHHLLRASSLLPHIITHNGYTGLRLR